MFSVLEAGLSNNVGMPETKEEFELLKSFLKSAGADTDDHKTWYSICSHITSKPPTEVKMNIQDLINIAKRLEINKLAQDQKMIAMAEIERKNMAELEAKLNEAKKAEEQAQTSNIIDMPSGPFSSEGEMPSLPGA